MASTKTETVKQKRNKQRTSPPDDLIKGPKISADLSEDELKKISGGAMHDKWITM